MASLKELAHPEWYGGGWGGEDTPTDQYYFEPPASSTKYTPSPFQEEYNWKSEPEYPSAPGGQIYIPGGMRTKVWDPELGGYKEVWTSDLKPDEPKGKSLSMGGGGSRTVPKTTTTTTRTPTRPEPKMPTIPAFVAPEWDESKIRKAAQRKAAPRLRSLRRQMEREAGRQYENPNVKRMTLRQAMEGYGLGVGSVMAEAEAAGRAEYGQEYGMEFAGAQTTYAAQTQALMQSYNNAFNAYLQSMQQVTTTGPTPAAEGGTDWSIGPLGPTPWTRASKNPFGYPTGGA